MPLKVKSGILIIQFLRGFMLTPIPRDGSTEVNFYNEEVEHINSTLSLREIGVKIAEIAFYTLVWAAVAYVGGAPILATVTVVAVFNFAGIMVETALDLLMQNESISVKNGSLIKNICLIIRTCTQIILLASISVIPNALAAALLYITLTFKINCLTLDFQKLSRAEPAYA